MASLFIVVLATMALVARYFMSRRSNAFSPNIATEYDAEVECNDAENHAVHTSGNLSNRKAVHDYKSVPAVAEESGTEQQYKFDLKNAVISQMILNSPYISENNK